MYENEYKLCLRNEEENRTKKWREISIRKKTDILKRKINYEVMFFGMREMRKEINKKLY